MKPVRILLTVVMMISLAGIAEADIIVKSKIVTDIMGAGKTEMSHANYIKPDRSCGESSTKFTGGLMAMMGAGKEKKSIDITRLDKAVMWMLNPEKKSYRETSFETLKKAYAAQSKGRPGQNPMAAGTDPEQYTWAIDVAEMKETGKVGGYTCKGMAAKATGVNKEDPEDKVVVTYKQWYSDKFPGYSTYKAYEDNFGKQLGSQQFGEQRRLATMLSMFGDKLDVLMDKMNEIEGMPMKSSMLVERTKGPYEMDEQAGEEEVDSMRAKMREIMGKPEKTESGMYKIFSIESEVLSVEESQIDGSKFSIPEGYTAQ
ncbi:MAG: hypothetical protein JSV44_08290 [Candidatus Zixiibacteriota bacterium]|nr:MAG: hypothetical protein JSV44_08290 [candidate division Zixibacteria bacterium]